MFLAPLLSPLLLRPIARFFFFSFFCFCAAHVLSILGSWTGSGKHSLNFFFLRCKCQRGFLYSFAEENFKRACCKIGSTVMLYLYKVVLGCPMKGAVPSSFLGMTSMCMAFIIFFSFLVIMFFDRRELVADVQCVIKTLLEFSCMYSAWYSETFNITLAISSRLHLPSVCSGRLCTSHTWKD